MSLQSLSKFISLLLRHDPGAAGLSLDAHGWMRVKDLCAALAERGQRLDLELIQHMMAVSDKQRWELSPGGTHIRAVHGHSVELEFDYQPAEPPETLIAPPQPTGDIDHEAELEQYMARLRRSGLALIWGPAGVGKLSLAASLAARLQARGQKVVWHSCRPPDVETNAGLRLLLALAAGLALDGRHARVGLREQGSPGPRRVRIHHERHEALAVRLERLGQR